MAVGQDEPDDRDVAVRDHARYQAYRVLTLYGLAFWGLTPILAEFGGSSTVLLLVLLGMPFFAMHLTLQQAIIL